MMLSQKSSAGYSREKISLYLLYTIPEHGYQITLKQLAMKISLSVHIRRQFNVFHYFNYISSKSIAIEFSTCISDFVFGYIFKQFKD